MISVAYNCARWLECDKLMEVMKESEHSKRHTTEGKLEMAASDGAAWSDRWVERNPKVASRGVLRTCEAGFL